MKIKIGIYDRDFGYSLALMEYINANACKRYEASCFSSERALEEFLVSEELNILLIGDHIDVGFSGIVLYLSGYDTDTKSRRIYKYQDVKGLLKDIDRVTSEHFNTYDRGIMYFVYSPIGRSGKTTLSKTLCKLRRDSLYLGFEDYGPLVLTGIDQDKISSRTDVATCGAEDEFLYYLRNHNTDITKYFDYKHISVGYSYEDVREVTKEDFFWMKELYFATHPKGVICIDMGVGALGSLKVLSSGDKILVPVPEGVDLLKIKSFYEKLEHEGLLDLEILEIKLCKETNMEEVIANNNL